MERTLTLFTDDSKESKEAKQLLKLYNIEFKEIKDNGEGVYPTLLVSDSAVPFIDLEGICQYIDMFAPEPSDLSFEEQLIFGERIIHK
ncbi:MAG TPA: hypothetical protein VG621_01365 [Candidatus Paceibacterota bacterium]|nr:hypothetical protein [Candidatus Paceibacterota bacterium]